MSQSNLMIVQGGGPTAVFNTSLAAIIDEAQKSPGIRRILGARFGVQGLIRDDIAELTDLDDRALHQLRQTPGAALRSSRYSPDEKDLKSLVSTLDRYDVGFLIFMGGNGTMRGAQIVSEFCRSEGLRELRVVGVPKTIDNDIEATDRCPGYASAARYFAVSTRELGADIRSLVQPVSILETLGRNAGWIAASTALAKMDDEDAPHLIYVPEIAFDQEQFLADLDSVVRRHKWAVVVVAEGIRHADGSPVYQMGDPSQADPLKRPLIGGAAQHLSGVVGKRLRIRCRSEKPGLLGRASIALISEQDRADAELVGRAGVQTLLAGAHHVMVALEPLSSANPDGYRLVPLMDAAGHERLIPTEWLQQGPIPVRDEFKRYVRPLIGSMDDHLTELPKAAAISGAGFR